MERKNFLILIEPQLDATGAESYLCVIWIFPDNEIQLSLKLLHNSIPCARESHDDEIVHSLSGIKSTHSTTVCGPTQLNIFVLATWIFISIQALKPSKKCVRERVRWCKIQLKYLSISHVNFHFRFACLGVGERWKTLLLLLLRF